MSNDLTFGMRLTYEGKAAAAGLEETRAGVEKVRVATSKMASEYSGLNQTVKQHTAAVTETERSVTKLLDRYDPLGAKLRQLQGDFKALDAAASSGKIAGRDDARVDAVYVKLQKEIAAASAATAAFGAESASAMSGLGLNTQYARRELMQLGKEAVTGDLSQMPNTFASLVTHSNLLSAALSPVGLAVAGVSAALVAGAVAWNHWENVAVESAEKTIKAINKAHSEAVRMAGLSTSAIDAEMASAKTLIQTNEAYAAHLIANITRFNWRDSAKQLGEYNEAIKEHNVKLEQLAAARVVAESQTGLAAELKNRIDAHKAEVKAYQGVKKSTDDYIASLEKETEAIGKNAYQRKYLEALAKMQTAATKGQRDEIMREFTAWSLATQAEEENTAAKKANSDATKASVEAAKAATKDRQDSMAALSGEYDALTKKLEADKYALSIIGKTKAEIALLAAMRGEDTLQTKIQEAAQLDATGTDEARLHVLREQIKLMLELRGVATETAATIAADEAIKKQAEDWKKFTGDIEHSLTDALMRGFESGNSFGENFVKSLENTLKTAALKVVVQAMVSPIMGGIQGMAQGGMPGGVGGFGDLMSAGNNLWNAGSSLFAGASTGMAAFSAAQMAGPVMSAAYTAPAIAAGTAAGGAAATGFMSSISTAMPYVGLAVLAYSLLKGNGGTPTASTGNASMQFDASGQRTFYDTYIGGSNASSGGNPAYSSAGTDAVITGMQSSYTNTAKSLGIGTVSTNFSYGGNTGKNGQSPNFALGGGAGASQFYQGETAYSDAAMGEAASRAVFAALQGSDLPAYLADLFDPKKHNAATMSSQDISNTLAFAGALKQVRDGLTSTATPISVAQDALDAIGSTAATFTQDFVAAIDGGMTPDKLALWQAAGAALGNLGDMSLTMTAAVPQLTQSTWEMWNTQTNSVRGMITEFDGSAAATHALSAATKERYATEQQLVIQISGAMGSLHTMFADSSEQIKLSMMDNQEKQQYYVDQANNYETLMHQATDPAKIEEYAKKLNQAEMNAWNTMDESQKKAMQAPYLANIDAADKYVQEKLGKTLDEITTTSGTDLPALISTAITDAMAAFTAAQTVVATAMQTAADTMQTAADTPVQVDTTLQFTANVPGDAQVAVLPRRRNHDDP